MGSARRPDWLAHLIASRAQTLEDLATAEMATIAVLSGDEGAELAVDALAEAALGAGFAVATCSLAERAMNDLHTVVGALAASLRMPRLEPSRRHGLVAALEAFAAAHGKRAVERFEESADAQGLGGELRTLAREFLAAASGQASARRIQAWLGGRDVSLDHTALRPLEARTAKRALAGLTRLVRVLGARGARILLTDAEALVDLSPGRREVAYAVLRELVDNADGGYGMVAAEILLVGTGALDRRVHSLFDHPALASRIRDASASGLPIPHQTWIRLGAPTDVELSEVPRPQPVPLRLARRLRAMIRIVQGLPPTEAVPELTVGMDEVDARIERLFEHARHDGSVFAMLVGEYGAGKTHHLLHLEARALARHRPVLRLSVERLDEDLGNPQRHLRRLIENAIVPSRKPMPLLECLDAWLRTDTGRKRLFEALRAIAKGDSEEASAARRALGRDGTIEDERVIEVLSAFDLVEKPSHRSYRRDAYRRIQLWIELLRRLENCEGPVLILDEAENLYRTGVSRAERRTALRSLGYYCGGALPRATVVLAVTPDTLAALREEAGEFLAEIEEQATLLPEENVAMLRHRLLKARPIPVTRLDQEQLATLAEQARRLAKEVRGKHVDHGWGAFLERAVEQSQTPRELLRSVMLRQERIAWLGEA
jgi:hypothetical protein